MGGQKKSEHDLSDDSSATDDDVNEIAARCRQ